MNRTRATVRMAALRRYPALGFLAIAALLALMLPTALRVPLSSPSSQAEVAPVSGRSQQEDALSDLSGASSGGLGSGAGNGAGSGNEAGPGAGTSQVKQRPAHVLRCVGSPARQTEDPISPSCVPYFEGDNGGATARGVTRGEVTVVVHAGSQGKSPLGYHDWEGPPEPSDTNYDTAGRAFAQYFNARYQTYGRHVHFYGYVGHAGTETADELRADAASIAHEKHPFAVVAAGLSSGAGPFASASAHEGLLAASYAGVDRSEYRVVAPNLITWLPDVEDQAAMATNFVCRALGKHAATFSSDPQLQRSPRVYGLYFDDDPNTEPLHHLADLITNGLSSSCGITVARVIGAGKNKSTTDYANAALTFKASNVTTIIDLEDGGISATTSHQAAAVGYFPEWIVAGGGAIEGAPDTNESATTHNQASWKAALGFTFDRFRVAPTQQAWYQAFREGCPSCPDPADVGPARLYDTLSLLMYGIQAAGPHLTIGNLDRGLHAIPPHRSSDPSAPAAYFADGNWSFVKDAMAIWWHPAGQPPGSAANGCYEVVNGHDRFRSAETPTDTSPFFQSGDCQANKKVA